MTQHIKYPEEVRDEAIEKALNKMPGKFFVSPDFFFIGTPHEYYSWDRNGGHEIVTRKRVIVGGNKQ